MKNIAQLLKQKHKIVDCNKFIKNLGNEDRENSKRFIELLEREFIPDPQKNKVQLFEKNKGADDLRNYLKKNKPFFVQVLKFTRQHLSPSKLQEELNDAMESKDLVNIELKLLRAIYFAKLQDEFNDEK
jgi:hypothetical protein